MSGKPIVIKFFKAVDDASITGLMNLIDQKTKEGAKEFIILMSTNGGSVFHGLSAYNYLKGLPVSIVTHNFGNVDSIGVTLYCAGSRRYSSPQARFLLHGISWGFQNCRLEEKQIEEILKSIQIDIENTAKVISANTGKAIGDVTKAMTDRITLNPEQAKEWGLVHEIKTELFEEGSEVISI